MPLDPILASQWRPATGGARNIFRGLRNKAIAATLSHWLPIPAALFARTRTLRFLLGVSVMRKLSLALALLVAGGIFAASTASFAGDTSKCDDIKDEKQKQECMDAAGGE